MSGGALEAVGLAGGYGALRVVHGVDLRVDAASVTALVGSNGAGKTTTLRVLAGVLPASAGIIGFEGVDISHWPAHARVERGLVMVPEGRLIFPAMTVEENLRVGAYAPRVRTRIKTNLERIYALFPRLRERRAQAGGTLSGGEQQMLAIGRGLMVEPRLLLLDEPTLGLAPALVEDIFIIIERLRRAGIAILLAEQNIHKTLALADRAYVLENGRITLHGPGPELLANPEVRRAYLGL
ncbi:MAG: ABC transporter ATP-binding protein [Gammaproteobacteria bacterium]